MFIILGETSQKSEKAFVTPAEGYGRMTWEKSIFFPAPVAMTSESDPSSAPLLS
jgi:hypothetical protein